LVTTETLEKAIATPAMTGLRAPAMASGMAATEAGQQLVLGHLVTGHDRYYTPLG
jgi:hypothetical protein